MTVAVQAEHEQSVWSHNLRNVAAELLIAVLIVLFFFSILFGVTNLYLPIGTSVKDLAQSIGRSVSQTASREPAVERPETETLQPLAAMLTEISNKVNIKPARDIAWSTAQTGMALHHRDAVQTYERAHALIEFNEGSYLDIGENSLVVFQSLESGLFANKARTLRVMVEGELRGKLLPSSSGPSSLQVAVPGSELQVSPAEGGGDDVEFKVRVNPDKTSTLAVHKGKAQVLVGGKRIRLEENDGLTLDVDGQPVPLSLPAAPILKAPHDSRVAYYRDLPPKIVFSWKPSGVVDGYRFMLARDPEFRDLVVDEELDSARFKHGNLKKGRYYWRVHALADKLEGRPSEIRQLSLMQDRKPPVLRLQPPPKVVHSDTVTLRGTTEPGAKVYVEGKQVIVNGQGIFKHRLRIKRGASLIVIEAVDPAGNVAYATKLVNGKY